MILHATQMAAALLLLGSLAHAQPAPRRPLTLPDAVGLALEHSKQLKINQADQAVASARLQQARNGHLPSIGVTVSYQRISDNIRPFTVALPGLGDVALNPQILDQSYNSLSVRQLIWGGGKVKLGVEAAKRETEALKFDAQQHRLGTADYVIDLWQQLYLFNVSEQLIRQNIALLTDRRRDVRNLEQQGLVLKNDGLKIDLAISNLEASLIDIRAGRAISQYNMALALNAPADTQFEIDSAEFNVPETPAPLADYLREAAANRPELTALDHRREAALLGKRLVESNRLPTLSWGGSYDYNRPNMRQFPARAEFVGTWQVGLALSFDLSGLYTNRAKETESRYGLERLSTAIEQARDGIQMEVNAAYQGYQQARQKIGVAQATVQQATENFRVEQNRLKAGATTPTDFLDANTQLLQAQLAVRSAKAAARLAQWKLQKSTGKLTN